MPNGTDSNIDGDDDLGRVLRSYAAVPNVGVEGSGAQQGINLLDDALKFIFSWVALMPIAIIVSGRYLGQLFKLPGSRKQFFQISIPHIICVRAQDDEVIFGFSIFFFFLIAIGFADGQNAASILKSRFGTNLGQFNSLCVLSALATLLLTIILYLIIRSTGRLRKKTDSAARERDRLIADLTPEKAEG